ncbi:hypothetical protein CsSME_00051911 [Camellia sinensis var. sinensis]
MGAVPSTLHQLLRFSTEHGIERVRGDQLQAKNCSMAAMKTTCNIREPGKAEIEDEDMEVLDDVGKEPAKKSEETLKKILVREGDEERFIQRRKVELDIEEQGGTSAICRAYII